MPPGGHASTETSPRRKLNVPSLACRFGLGGPHRQHRPKYGEIEYGGLPVNYSVFVSMLCYKGFQPPYRTDN